MATTVIDTMIVLTADTVTNIYSVGSNQRATVTISVTNQSGSEIPAYYIYRALNGAAHDDAHAWIDGESLSSPGSGESFSKVFFDGTVIRAKSAVAGLMVWINGISEDIV